MNKTIRFLATITFIAFASVNYGQNPYLGVKAGLNLSHMTLKDDNGKLTKTLNFAPGFNAGLTMDYRMIPGLTLNTSLLISTKGYQERTKEDFRGVEIKSTERLTLFYVELPIYVKYELELGLLDFFAGGGPFIGYGYWGKRNWRREGGGETEWGKEDVNFGSDPELHDFKNIDYGLGVMAGGKIDNYVLEFGYNFSIANISTATDKGQVARNGVVFVSVSYYFSRFYKYGEANF